MIKKKLSDFYRLKNFNAKKFSFLFQLTDWDIKLFGHEDVTRGKLEHKIKSLLKTVPSTHATAFGMEFTPPEQKWTFFPHTQVAALNGSRGTEGLTTGDDATSWDANIGNNKHLGQWPVNYIKTPVDNIIDTRAATQVNKVRMAHLRNTHGLYGATTVRWRNPNRSYIYTQNDDNSFEPTEC